MMLADSPPHQQQQEQQETYQQIKPKAKLNHEFRVHSSKDFKKGRIFKILWSEPLGNRNPLGSTFDGEIGSIRDSKFSEFAYNSVRRFVIVKARKGHCVCVPILTYGGQGTAKKGVKADDHAMIYTGNKAPKEVSGEKKLNKKAVRVHNPSEKDKLAVESRVNYSKVYTIEHNISVCFIGEVHKDSQSIFFADFKRTFDESDEGEGEPENRKRA